MSLEIQPRAPAEVQIARCLYAHLVVCKARNCFAPGTFSARYLDAWRIFVGQFELCECGVPDGI